MMGNNGLVFPDLLMLNDYQGNFQNYFQAVYSVFEQDFIKSQPLYDGKKVSAQKHPEVDGIHRTFYHITHEGEDESNRSPDIRRMERIRFPTLTTVSMTKYWFGKIPVGKIQGYCCSMKLKDMW